MLGISFDVVDDHLGRGSAHFECRHLHGGHRGLQHSPDTVTGEADDLDILRDMQAAFRNGTDRPQALYINRSHNGIQVGILVEKLVGAVVAIAKAVDFPV